MRRFITLLLLSLTPSLALAATPLDKAYLKESAFLKAEKAALESRRDALDKSIADRLGGHVSPSFDRARDFLEREMDAGRLRRSDPSMLLLSIYSTVVGVATELEVQRAMGMAPTLRATVGRRQELIRFLRAALAPEP